MTSPPERPTGDGAVVDTEPRPPQPANGRRNVRERIAGAAKSAYARAEPVTQNAKARIAQEQPSSRKGVAIGWFARFREADGQLYSLVLAAYLFLTIIPATLALATYVDSDPRALASRLIDRLGLTGATANLVRSVLTGAGDHQLTATLIAVVSVIAFGLGIGRTLQLVYGRVWHVPARGFIVTDKLRYLAWLLAFLAAIFVYVIETALLRSASGWVEWVLAPFWVIGLIYFLAWTPVLLLHSRISLRDALPGAVLATAGWLGLRILSSLLFTNWLNWYAKYYGGLGIVMALFFWLALAMTILIVAAALSPAYAVRRQARSSAAGLPSTGADQTAGQAK